MATMRRLSEFLFFATDFRKLDLEPALFTRVYVVSEGSGMHLMTSFSYCNLSSSFDSRDISQ
jgi:hypothetical protein